MATIYFSMSGEGRGHATRALALVDRLRRRHDVRVFAPGDAHELLAPACRERDVPVTRIPGISHAYDGRGRLDTLRTALGGARYAGRLPGTLRRLERIFERERPDLVVTDFEAALPRVAERLGVPYVSVDHQHFLLVNDLAGLPARLRRLARIVSLVVLAYYRRQRETIVSSFYRTPLRRRWRGVTQVGVLLRPELASFPARHGEHLTVYIRRKAPPGLLATLRRSGREIRVYGLGARPPDGALHFRAIDARRFLADLGTGHALVCTAGNQLVGEAFHLGKPVLSLPEEGNFEQEINARFVAKSGAGDFAPIRELDGRRLGLFLERVEEYRSRIDREFTDGTDAAVAAIRRHLPGTARGHVHSLAPRPPQRAAEASA